MGYIYIITNKNNDKVYIGQTSRTIEARWKEHLLSSQDEAKRHYKLYAAMNKYGVDSFSIGKIEQCESEKLNEREQYWINRFDSYANGYNMTIGGDGIQTVDTEKIQRLWDSGAAIVDISRETGYATSTVLQRLESHKTFSHEEAANRGVKLSAKAKEKIIYVYNQNGEQIKKFSCAEDASEKIGESVEKIRTWCRKQVPKNNKLYSYEPLTNEQIINCFLHQPNHKAIRQISLDGKELAVYESIQEAIRQTGINNICKVTKGETKTAGGYIWKYVDDNECLVPIKSTQNKRQVAQYSLEGQLIQIYNSITEAAKATGQKSSSNISQVCKGKAQTAGGYVWRYYEENNQ